MSSTTTVVVIAAIIWIVTFPIAWLLLAQLVAMVTSANRPFLSLRFWGYFCLYQGVIIAPYLVLLVYGTELPSFFRDFLIGIIVVSILLTGFRFIGKTKTVAALWWAYGWVYDGLNFFYPYRHLKALVVARLNVEPGMKVLDLGCGTGNVMRDTLASEPTLQIVGVDNSSTMLRKASRKVMNYKDATVVRDDVLHYLGTLADGEFDRIVMLNVVYAVKDRERLWTEAIRVLKPEGKIIATTSDRGGSKAITREHLNNSPWWTLLHPTLILVGFIDYFISELARTDVFAFLSQEDLEREIKHAGGSMEAVERCYGGSVDGVNLLFNVVHR